MTKYDAIRDVALYTSVNEGDARIVIDRLMLDPDSADLFDPDRCSMKEYDALDKRCEEMEAQRDALDKRCEEMEAQRDAARLEVVKLKELLAEMEIELNNEHETSVHGESI